MVEMTVKPSAAWASFFFEGVVRRLMPIGPLIRRQSPRPEHSHTRGGRRIQPAEHSGISGNRDSSGDLPHASSAPRDHQNTFRGFLSEQSCSGRMVMLERVASPRHNTEAAASERCAVDHVATLTAGWPQPCRCGGSSDGELRLGTRASAAPSRTASTLLHVGWVSRSTPRAARQGRRSPPCAFPPLRTVLSSAFKRRNARDDSRVPQRRRSSV